MFEHEIHPANGYSQESLSNSRFSIQLVDKIGSHLHQLALVHSLYQVTQVEHYFNCRALFNLHHTINNLCGIT